MFWLLLGIGAGVAIAAYQASRASAATSTPAPPAPPAPTETPRVPTPPPQSREGARFDPLVERWRPEVTRAAQKYGVPVDPALKWIQIESGGDLSSIGSPFEVGPFQLNLNPHEAGNDGRFGATLEGLRVVARKSDERAKQHQDVSDVSWLTPAELDMAIGAGVRKVASAIQTARDMFAKTNTSWPEISPDFGNAVKQIHAAPAVVTELLPKIVARDGRSPSNWEELHRLAMAFPVAQMGDGLRSLANSPSKHGLVNRLEDTLFNAEEFGQASKFGPAWPGNGGVTRVTLEVTDVREAPREP